MNPLLTQALHGLKIEQPGPPPCLRVLKLDTPSDNFLNILQKYGPSEAPGALREPGQARRYPSHPCPQGVRKGQTLQAPDGGFNQHCLFIKLCPTDCNSLKDRRMSPYFNLSKAWLLRNMPFH